MSAQPGRSADGKSKAVDPANVAANLRDLTVHLHRGNAAAAKTIASQADYLASRKLTRQDIEECQRRAAILETCIARCTVRPLLHAS